MVWYLGFKPVGGSYYNMDALDGDTSLIECEDMRQDDGTTIHRGDSCINAGKRLKTGHVITKILWHSRRPVPDIYGPFMAVAVSGRFREIVEELEPGVHQWLPVEFVDKKKNHLAHRWYFIPCNRIDSVDEDHTTMVKYKGGWSNPKNLIRRGEEHLLPDDYDPENKIRYVFSESKAAGYHAWRDKGIRIYHHLISDELAALLKAADLSGLDLIKAESV